MHERWWVQRVELDGIHGGQSIEVDLSPGLNVIYGHNGCGKTTLLHVLANLLEGDVSQFLGLQFQRVRVNCYGLPPLELTRTPGSSEDNRAFRFTCGDRTCQVLSSSKLDEAQQREIDELLAGTPVYLPAFRAVLEAAGTRRDYGLVYRESHMPQSDSEAERLFERERHKALRRQRADARTAEPARALVGRSTAARRPVNLQRDADRAVAKTMMCRHWFGPFVPVVRYPSLADVADALERELVSASNNTSQADVDMMVDVMQDVLIMTQKHTTQAATEEPPSLPAEQLVQGLIAKLQPLADRSQQRALYGQLLEKLRQLLGERMSSAVLDIIGVYDRAIDARNTKEEEAFRRLRTFEASVNRFLEGKQLRVNWRPERGIPTSFGAPGGAARLVYDGGHERSMNVLSSGERQVIAMLFAASHLDEADSILLIDEPELSLHVDWQRYILTEVMEQAEGRQVVVCTHSPEIHAAHDDVVRELVPTAWCGDEQQDDVLGDVSEV